VPATADGADPATPPKFKVWKPAFKESQVTTQIVEEDVSVPLERAPAGYKQPHDDRPSSGPLFKSALD
jgi:hypothetical protein